MKKNTLFILACAMMVCTGLRAQDKKEACKANKEKFGKTDLMRDADFAVNTAEAGMMEVMLGKLAATNAASQEVKDFAARMVSDHTEASSQLEATAKRKNITMPGILSKKCQKKYDHFTRKKGKKFDKCYTHYMVKDHKKDIGHFKKEADKGNDPEIKAWAAGKVPVLENHLEMAKKACKAAKKE